ncbi:MAG: CBS domain-containing protein [Acidobacteria bacterium]|nr:MAG: CBS domain-containing protein [Acidobacteriota bacterium]REK06133.1 MAG: CBS domain-containing protein [Acidobacteriota bacterium]
MNVKIHDLMQKRVLTLQRHNTVTDARELVKKRRLSALPIVGSDGEVLGIVSTTDLAGELNEGTPLSKVMTERVYTIPEYNDVSMAARVMRRRKVHHVVVTKEKKIVGIISSFDLLKLVEGHRFVAKPAPSESRKKKRNT